jgi:antitoxin component of MazEF toxin-antitoxin module
MQRLKRVGKQLALIFPKELLVAAHLDEETEVEISTDGDTITLSPLRESRQTTKIKAVDLASFPEKK